ncbi:unnamed protein product [Lymnaea stagnalis]|uniref:F-box domain-containing protein n=1 Tax=Lymnaea stagnalis TaxID=6523 RepID=A0AAV2HPY9_LYMST
MSLSVSDLEKFRQEWRKELEHDKLSNDDTSSQYHTGTGLDQNTINNAHSSHSPLTQSYSTAAQQNIDHTSNDLLINNDKNKIDSYKDVTVNVIDDTSQDADGDSEHDKTSKNFNLSDDNSEYYPFKILTQFLNEAPKRLKTIKDNKSNVISSELNYFSKHTYFNNEISITENSSKKMKTIQRESDALKEEDGKIVKPKPILDIFIADLDEINEIPFFDTSLPREVALQIFQHLDMKTLCSCSQVSHSWRSLADDELLWCRICHNLGYGTEMELSDGQNWKGKVRRHIEKKRLQHTNWKARIGKPYHLSFPRGGVLCAVHSHNSTIVSGVQTKALAFKLDNSKYTSCNVRSWNTQTGDVCTYNASNTALVIDENATDLGRIHNEIKHISTTALVTAASFKHGFVDIWYNEEGTEPVHTIRFNNPDITSLSVHDVSAKCSVIAASQGHRVQLASIGGTQEGSILDFDMHAAVTFVDWFTSGYSSTPLLLLTCNNTVHLKKIEMGFSCASAQQENMTEVHNIIWAPITAIGFRESFHEIAVGYNLYAPSTQVKVNVYDSNNNQLKASLTGHTWLISSIHMPDSLPHQLVTGSGDRKIRMYDTRLGSSASMTLVGHVARVRTVQMDGWKIVSGDEGGFVCVWDQRMRQKLWDIHNRHPVEYCHFDERLLIVGNVPYQKFPQQDEFETVSSLRYRGTVQVYDFLANQQTQGIPDICLSSYNEPEAYDYNLALTVPYDVVS